VRTGAGNGLERARKNWGRELEQRKSSDDRTHQVAVGLSELAGVDAVSRSHIRAIDWRRGSLATDAQAAAGPRPGVARAHRSVELDHRPVRSSESSRSSLRSEVTGARGGVAAGSVGGVIHPCRTASASNASSKTGFRPFAVDRARPRRDRDPCGAPRRQGVSMRDEGGVPDDRYGTSRGLIQRRPEKREKSASQEFNSAPCSMARAARCASFTRFPAVPKGLRSCRMTAP
jgi:hypothetical protein